MSETDDVRALVRRFLAAFESLDLDAFMDCFAPSATAFFPEPEPAHRHDGRPAIRDRFASVFATIRHAATAGSPPYHRLEPEELGEQMIGGDTAVITFHLRDEARTARRTLVLRRGADGWQVVHLHASNVAPR